MADGQIVLFEEDGNLFESLARENGTRSWSARELMRHLGYESWSAFKKVINKAISACSLLQLSVFQHFSEVDGGADYKLSRQACIMVVLNADSAKTPVAAMQVYFVGLLDQVLDLKLHHAEVMDRLFIREEISEREETLTDTATRAGVESYSRFQMAGYKGMYEMDYQALRKLRGLSDSPRRSLLDFMGKDELAANLFRLSLTEQRIRNENTRGQQNLEQVAKEVGHKVRQTVHEEAGVYPEQLPTAQDIQTAKKGLRRGSKEIGKIDDLQQERSNEQLFLETYRPLDDPEVESCSECRGGNEASHFGSPHCQSGSLASGGSTAHCRCDFCF